MSTTKRTVKIAQLEEKLRQLKVREPAAEARRWCARMIGGCSGCSATVVLIAGVPARPTSETATRRFERRSASSNTAVCHVGPEVGSVPILRPLVFMGITAVVAVLWHWRVSRFWIASCLATLTSVVLFYVIALSGVFDLGPFAMHLEYFFLAEILHTDFLTAFWLTVLVSSVTGAFVVALVVGWVMRRARRRREHGVAAP
jgi:hypothetical protein